MAQPSLLAQASPALSDDPSGAQPSMVARARASVYRLLLRNGVEGLVLRKWYIYNLRLIKCIKYTKYTKFTKYELWYLYKIKNNT